MKRGSAVFRLSIGLTFLTISIVLGARMLRIIPNGKDEALKRRQDLCEFLAIQCSLSAQRQDFETMRQAIIALAARHRDLQSAVVYAKDATVLAYHRDGQSTDSSSGEAIAASDSHVDRIRVPIFEDDVEWGAVDVSFTPFGGTGWIAVLYTPEVQLSLFVGLLAFFSFVMYLRRALAHLDPSSVIPERVKTMLDTLAEGVLVLDKDERILLANTAFGQIVGEKAGALVGRKASMLPWTTKIVEGRKATMPWLAAMEAGASQTGVTLALQSGPEVQRTVVVNSSPILSADRRVRGGMATFDDVTHIEQKNAQLNEMLSVLQQSRDEINQKNRELQILATIDPLTGCLNRRSFFEQATGRWSDATRYGHTLSVLLVDVDHFKKINDTHGHSVGDQVLQHVAETLKGLARGGDLVCRYGGEEFCILLGHATIEDATLAAERYRRGIEQRDCGGAVRITASLGVSSMQLGAKDLQELIDQADQALYASKRGGRNRATRWDAIPPEALEAKQVEHVVVRHTHMPIPYRTVTALHAALAQRDLATAEHSTRVAELCVRMGRQMMTAAECFTLEVAALLHDIGKLGVPDAILLKPGPLTAEEWEVMHSHDRMGTEIVGALASRELTQIVAAHHAWYQGSESHPHLPTGKAIPVGARILTIADAYDAMVSDRPYRRGRSPQEAFVELRRCAGTQFDPELVERFVATLEADGIQSPTSAQSAAARIAVELERLTTAVEERNVQALTETAAYLATTAAEAGLIEISALAQRVRNPEAALEESLQAAGELLGACRQTIEAVHGDRCEIPDGLASVEPSVAWASRASRSA